MVKVRIAALPPSAEVAIVLASTFGLSTLLYGANILRHGYRPSIAFTNSRLLGLIVVEFVLGLLLAVFLHARGWRWEHLRVEVGWRPTLHGVALWIGSLFLIGAVFTVALSIPSLQSRLDTVRFRRFQRRTECLASPGGPRLSGPRRGCCNPADRHSFRLVLLEAPQPMAPDPRPRDHGFRRFPATLGTGTAASAAPSASRTR